MRSSALTLCSLLALSALGCQKDDGVEEADFIGGGDAPATVPGGGFGPSSRDAGIRDADGSADADGGSANDQLATCSVVFDPFDVAMEAPTAQSFSVLATENQLQIAYLVPACGGVIGSSTNYDLRTVTLASTGEISGPNTLSGLGEIECLVRRDPALTENELFYVANTRGFQLTRVATDQSTPVAREVSNVIGLVPEALDAVSLGELSLSFWATQDVGNDTSDILVFRDDQTEPVTSVLTSDEGQRVVSLSASRLNSPAGALSRAVVAWASDSDTAKGLFARVIDEDATLSSTVTLSTKVGAASSIDATANGSSGAVVYAVSGSLDRYELRFRSIDVQGAFGPEVKVTSGNENLVDPSIAPFAQGYVIAARALSAAGTAVIRLTFIDEDGRVAGTRDLASAAATPARVRVRSARDGRLFLVWSDVDAASTTLRARRVECGVGR